MTILKEGLKNATAMVVIIYFKKTKYLVKESPKGSLYCDPSERISKGFTVL